MNGSRWEWRQSQYEMLSIALARQHRVMNCNMRLMWFDTYEYDVHKWDWGGEYIYSSSQTQIPILGITELSETWK